MKKNVEGIKKFLPKRFNKDTTEDQKSILLTPMKLFDIKNTIASLFRNSLIGSLEYQNTAKVEQKRVAERTKIRRQKKSDDKHTTDMPKLDREKSAS